MALAGCILLDGNKDGSLRFDYKLAYGNITEETKSRFLKRHRTKVFWHLWVEGEGLIVDFGEKVIGVPVTMPNDMIVLFSNEKIAAALKCHKSIYDLLNKEMRKDGERLKEATQKSERVSSELYPPQNTTDRLKREAEVAEKINKCHIRIYDSFTRIVRGISQKSNDEPLMPLVYKKRLQLIKMSG
jgi:hypothetical protein